MYTFLTTRRFALWWRLARQWYGSRLDNAVATIIDSLPKEASDETVYDEIFSYTNTSMSAWKQVFCSFYDSDNDEYTKFAGIANMLSIVDMLSSQITEKRIILYVGNYTIHLTKNMSNGVISIYTDNLT